PPSEPSSRPPSSRGGGWRLVFTALAMAVLIAAGFVARGLIEDPGSPTAVTTITPSSLPAGTTPVVNGGGDEPVAAVAAAVSPAVVQIETGSGLGSGTIYDPSGLIMTNAHVVGNARSVNVRLADGSSHQGRVLGADPSSDIAVVKIDANDLPVARLGDGQVQVGQMAIALGSPFGLSQTVTAGIISAVDRPVPNQVGVAVNMLQTDAPINPGNSGGALANRNGEIIGVPTSIFSQNGENNGIGFAVPIDTAKRVADRIVNGQSLDKAVLGIQGSSRTTSSDPGAVVQSVVPGGPAAAAGIQVGDRIVAVDGKPVRTFEELQGRIGTYSPGDRVQVTFVRDRETHSVEVTLGSGR
ncbi:S1C family serine protease, partial [Rhabdothermincola sp.]|uniref:S1C family serine protease n=1 Tax=Rhabdothermincola sp. TaxID=2820405 RepID=UPI002FE0190C